MVSKKVMKNVGKLALAAAILGVGVAGPLTSTKASAMSYSGYTPATLGEACEMAYWYYFLR